MPLVRPTERPADAGRARRGRARRGPGRAGLVAAAVLLVGTALGSAPPAHASTATLTGRVTGAGAPVPGAVVVVSPVTGQSGTGQFVTGQSGTGPPGTGLSRTVTTTDASGTYRLDGLPVGEVQLVVRAPLDSRFADTWFPAAPTRATAEPLQLGSTPVRADVDLPVGGSVTGRLVDRADGTPVAGATVRAVLAADARGEAVGRLALTRDPGSFALTGLPPAELQLDVRVPPGGTHLAPDVADPPIVIDGARDTAGLVVTLDRASEVTGTVRDDTGAPVAGAVVALDGCRIPCPPPTSTDQSGAYSIRGIRPGEEMSVTAWRSGDLLRQLLPEADTGSRSARFTLGPGELRAPVDLTLARTAFVTVEVGGTRRAEPLQVIVRLAGPQWTYHQYVGHAPDPGGTGSPSAGPGAPGAPDDPVRVRVGPIPAGAYAVRLSPGATNPGYLPTHWVTTNARETEPTVRVSPGQEVLIRAALGDASELGDGPVPADGPEVATTEAPGKSTPPLQEADPGQWPRPFTGFLSPPAWAATGVAGTGVAGTTPEGTAAGTGADRRGSDPDSRPCR